MSKVTVKFQLESTTPINFPANFEAFLQDLLETAVLPALGAELVPLTLEVKKARN